MATIVASLVSGLAALIVCMINNHFEHKSQQAQANESSNLIAYRLEQLELKVTKHNELIERTYKLEEHTAVVDEQIKVANHRIADLEKKVGES